MLLAQAGGVQLVDDALLQPILAAMLLSMLSAPFLIQYSDKLVLRFVGSEWMLRSLRCTRSPSPAWRPQITWCCAAMAAPARTWRVF